ncbi:MAG: hypothetical protein HQM13_15695 [SAR324 cluster bacterium]|nr:hypothetical protein [SAR324 cluster bacterium]
MDSPQLQPLNGEEFSSFLDLIPSESKSPEFHAAWQSIQKNVQQYPGNSSILDFNEIFVEVMMLEILAYPILQEDAHGPLKSGESKRIFEQFQTALEQMKNLKSELQQQKINNLELEDQTALLFEKLKSVYFEMRKQWNKYKKEWQKFKVLKKQKQESSKEENEEEKAAKVNKGKESTEEDGLEAPHFNRVGWKVIQVSFNALLLEIRFRVKWKKFVCTEADVFRYPLFQVLVEEIREIDEKTQGFELLERAQLAQTRNKQLARRLQFLNDPDLILPDRSRTANGEEGEENYGKTKHAPVKKSKKALLIIPLIGLIIGVLSLLSLFLKPDSKQPKSFQSQSFNEAGMASQKGSSFETVVVPERQQSKSTFPQLAESKKGGLPVYAPNESMKKLSDAQEVTREMLQKTMAEVNELAVLVVNENSAQLISGENLLLFETLAEFEKFLDEVADQYQRMIEIAEVLGENLSQYDISVLTAKEGEATGYTLVLRNKNDQVVGKINFSTTDLKLQWENIEDTLVVKSVQELINAIRFLANSR